MFPTPPEPATEKNRAKNRAQASMSPYTFPLDNLFGHLSSADLSVCRFFDFPSPLTALEEVTENCPEDQMLESQLRSFEKLFEGREYGDESLSDVVLRSSCRLLEPESEAPIVTQNECEYGGDGNNLRRVCSTGDLSNFMPKNVLKTQRSLSGALPVPTEDHLDPHRAGRYSAEQRRMCIDKYRAKRSLRNFNKTIKYECRKTLADNRPRIRGRFRRNEEPGENDRKSPEEHVIWMERFHAMSWEESGVIYGGQILGDCGQVQFGYPGGFS